MLSDGDQDRLVVSSGVNRRDLVESSWETSVDGCGKQAVDGSSIETLEEGELSGVGGGSLVESGELLDDDVRVANDLALGVDLLGSSEIVLGRVHESTRLEVGNSHSDREGRVLSERVTVLGDSELGRGHVISTGDDTHRGRVT